jgi:hypothetical protein
MGGTARKEHVAHEGHEVPYWTSGGYRTGSRSLTEAAEPCPTKRRVPYGPGGLSPVPYTSAASTQVVGSEPRSHTSTGAS